VTWLDKCTISAIMILYVAYFHSIASYGIILEGNSSNSKKYSQLWWEHTLELHVEGCLKNQRF
jgi:hypothetical protein